MIEHDRHLVVRPVPNDPVEAPMGAYQGAGPTTEELRAEARVEPERDE
ncbi:MAG TPA: hypothetical protein VES95_02980 [Dermatophilaceae bacterium]|nr:hypothetical protein [Dermatophilaceae bacterium]